MTTASEGDRPLTTWNDTQADYPAPIACLTKTDVSKTSRYGSQVAS